MDRLLKDAMNTRLTQPVNCPDAERLAAWADGTIYGTDAEGIESHVADCERCQAVVAAFVATEPAPVPVATVEADAPALSEVVPFRKRSPVMRWVPFVVSAAAASLVLWLAWPKPPATDTPTPVSTTASAGNTAPASSQLRYEPSPTPVIGAAPRGDKTDKTGLTAKSAEKTATPAKTAADVAAPPAQSARAQTVPAAPAPAPPPPAVLPTPLAQPKPAATPVTATTAAGSVALPPPPPASSQTTAFRNVALDGVATVSFLMALPGGGVEFGPTDPVAEVTLTPTRQGVASAPRNPLKAIRWRVITGVVEKTIDGGASWSRIVIDSSLSITTGASPSSVVCWLAGKAGAVLRSTDGGKTFVRVTTPATADLVSITAADGLTATVATSDGRRLTTTDGGQTWTR